MPQPRGGGGRGGGGGGDNGGHRGGDGGGGPPFQPGQAPQIAQPAGPQLMDKFIGNPPLPFTGDRTKAEDFLTQWGLYCRANRDNAALQNQYQKSMLFLTYIQGKLVQPWVVAVARWLELRVMHHHVNEFNPVLWHNIEGAFCRQFADTMKKEKAQDIL
jgi:hypothetical protein